MGRVGELSLEDHNKREKNNILRSFFSAKGSVMHLSIAIDYRDDCVGLPLAG
jgi:hypothetical protein